MCVPHNEAKLGLISPKGANQTQQADHPFVSAFGPQKTVKNTKYTVVRIIVIQYILSSIGSTINFLPVDFGSTNRRKLFYFSIW